MRILLTGGSEFIGSHLREKLHNVELVNLDINVPLINDNSKHQFIKGIFVVLMMWIKLYKTAML